jgi:hypothetical protein
LVWNGWTGAIEGVFIRTPDRPESPTYASVPPTEGLAADVREAIIDYLATRIVNAVWPARSTGTDPAASSAEPLTVLDPRLLAAELVAAIVQVAAVHAGIPAPVAQVMGKFAGKAAQDLLASSLSPDPLARKVEVDLMLSAKDGSVINNPALPGRVVGATAGVFDEDPHAPVAGPRGMRPDDTGAPRPASPGWYWWDGARWSDQGPSKGPGPEPGGQRSSPISP